jgi:hypothetical protein
MELDHVFKYHAPEPEQLAKYQTLRDAAHTFATVILENTPVGADQTAAIRKVREAVMTANAAVAWKGRL